MILVKREARSNGAEATKTSADGGSVENSFDNLGQKKGAKSVQRSSFDEIQVSLSFFF